MVVYIPPLRIGELVEVIEVNLGTVGVCDLDSLACRFGDGKVHQDSVVVG